MKTITDITHINTKTAEGKLLYAAMLELTTKTHRSITPDQMLKLLNKIWDRTSKLRSLKGDQTTGTKARR